MHRNCHTSTDTYELTFTFSSVWGLSHPGRASHTSVGRGRNIIRKRHTSTGNRNRKSGAPEEWASSTEPGDGAVPEPVPRDPSPLADRASAGVPGVELGALRPFAPVAPFPRTSPFPPRPISRVCLDCPTSERTLPAPVVYYYSTRKHKYYACGDYHCNPLSERLRRCHLSTHRMGGAPLMFFGEGRSY